MFDSLIEDTSGACTKPKAYFRLSLLEQPFSETVNYGSGKVATFLLHMDLL